MTDASNFLKAVLNNIRILRENKKITTAQLEEKLILGPGWISSFEKGECIPSIDMLLAILHEIGATLHDLLKNLPEHPETAMVDRFIFAEQSGKDTVVHFRYANFDSQYRLENSKIEDFETVIKVLRDKLSALTSADSSINEAIKTEAVASSFLKAVEVWPNANPSDIWWFIIYRAYCDPFNHPARYARLDFTQSWKRTGGWALEEVLVRHYKDFFKLHGINIFIADNAAKQKIVHKLNIKDRIEADKIDVVLTGDTKSGPQFFGVVHVKASFAERRTDDVPMSIALSKAGYVSPLWTMDCKSTPSIHPTNKGELGSVDGRRSAKRKDIEDEGYFTGCFSYNKNTQLSSSSVPAKRKIYVCDFRNPDDNFSNFIIKQWQDIQSS